MSEQTRAGLRRWWRESWEAAGLPAPGPAACDAVIARYAERHRAYHSVQHLCECRERFGEARHLAASPGAVQLALWFHDAIYDTRADDSEPRSAALARRAIAGAGGSAALAEEVATLVLATCHDAVPQRPDARLVVDVDLAILGASPERFAEYEDQVRAEYAWVGDRDFAAGRAAVLRHFLDRRWIYGTPFFRGRREARARENLAAAVVRWEAAGG